MRKLTSHPSFIPLLAFRWTVSYLTQTNTTSSDDQDLFLSVFLIISSQCFNDPSTNVIVGFRAALSNIIPDDIIPMSSRRLWANFLIYGTGTFIAGNS